MKNKGSRMTFLKEITASMLWRVSVCMSGTHIANRVYAVGKRYEALSCKHVFLTVKPYLFFEMLLPPGVNCGSYHISSGI